MNDKVRQIFDILGLEPEEEFKIKGQNETYKFDIVLQLFFMNSCTNDNWQLSHKPIGCVVSREIIKIPQKPRLTNKDKIAIKFLKNCGWHYIARDKDKSLCAYKDKPYKQDDEWDVVEFGCMLLMVGAGENILDLKISWEDTEPLCLDDFSDVELKED